MNYCEQTFVSGQCPGHDGGYEDCLTPALITLGWSGYCAGAPEFEGRLTGYTLIARFALPISDAPGAAVVDVPAGYYMRWEAGDGRMYTRPAASAADVISALKRTELRYTLWRNGCNPDDPDAHDHCADGCQVNG